MSPQGPAPVRPESMEGLPPPEALLRPFGSLSSALGVTVPLAIVPGPAMARGHEACSQRKPWVWAGGGTTVARNVPPPGRGPQGSGWGGRGGERAGTALSGIFGGA